MKNLKIDENPNLKQNLKKIDIKKYLMIKLKLFI
jgi:hypothetical protein